MATLGVWSHAGRSRCARRTGSRAFTAAAAARRAAGATPARRQSERRAHRLDASTSSCSARWKNRVTAYFSDLPERTSAALLVVDNATLEARAYVGSVEFADKRAAGPCRHGQGLAFAGFDAEAVPVRTGARRRPDPFGKPAGRCATGVRRLPAGQLRHGVQWPGRRGARRCVCRSMCRRSTCSIESARRVSRRGSPTPAST